jgi:hypothetical protein
MNRLCRAGQRSNTFAPTSTQEFVCRRVSVTGAAFWLLRRIFALS